MGKISLPDENWALLREPDDLTEGQRRPLLRMQERILASDVGEVMRKRSQIKKMSEEEQLKLMRGVLGTDDWARLDESVDALILALVKEWSFEQPITLDGLMSLTRRHYKALRDECEPLLPRVLDENVDEDIADPTPAGPGASD